MKKTLKEFIGDAISMHGNKYDYSKVKYINNSRKVCIICTKHGEFYQLPSNHLKGQGCPKCKRETLRILKSKSKEDFIFEAKLIHNNKYDYSKVNYVNNRTKICIICPTHGEFWQEPRAHLKGQGCSKCSKNCKLTKEEFINLSNSIHNDKYEYSKVKYINANTTVCIICPTHGEFWQTPHNHTHAQNPQGCPKCCSSRMEKEIRTYLMNSHIDFEEQKRFEWLGRQSLDFYIPYGKIAIECQGIQHFKENEHFGGQYGFKEIIYRDELKRLLCLKNGIRLLYYANYKYNFPYQVFTNKEELVDTIKKII